MNLINYCILHQMNLVLNYLVSLANIVLLQVIWWQWRLEEKLIIEKIQASS